MGRKEIKFIPWKDVIIVQMTLFVLAWNSSFPIAFAGYYADIGASDATNIALCYLIIMGTYYAGKALSAPCWIWLVGSCEKRSLLSCNLIAVTSFTFLFGVCSNIIPAAFLRFLVGIFSITQPTIDDLLREYSEWQMEKYYQVTKTSTLVYICGITTGLIIGGLTAFPYDTGANHTEIFHELPFMLPSLIVACMCALCFLIVFIELKDPPKPPQPLLRQAPGQQQAPVLTPIVAAAQEIRETQPPPPMFASIQPGKIEALQSSTKPQGYAEFTETLETQQNEEEDGTDHGPLTLRKENKGEEISNFDFTKYLLDQSSQSEVQLGEDNETESPPSSRGPDTFRAEELRSPSGGLRSPSVGLRSPSSNPRSPSGGLRSPTGEEYKCTHISIMDEDDLENPDLGLNADQGFHIDPSIPRMNIEDIFKRPNMSKSKLCIYKPSQIALSMHLLSYTGLIYVEELIVVYVLVSYDLAPYEFGSIIAGIYIITNLANYFILPRLLERIPTIQIASLNISGSNLTLLSCLVLLMCPLEQEVTMALLLPGLALFKYFSIQFQCVSMLYVSDSVDSNNMPFIRNFTYCFKEFIRTLMIFGCPLVILATIDIEISIILPMAIAIAIIGPTYAFFNPLKRNFPRLQNPYKEDD